MYGAKSTKYDYICEWPLMSVQSKLKVLAYGTIVTRKQLDTSCTGGTQLESTWMLLSMVLSRDAHDKVRIQQVRVSMGTITSANDSANHSRTFHI